VVAGFVLFGFRVAGGSAGAIASIAGGHWGAQGGTGGLWGSHGATSVSQRASVSFYTDLRTWTANPCSEFTGEHVKLRGGAGIRSWHALLGPRVPEVPLGK